VRGVIAGCVAVACAVAPARAATCPAPPDGAPGLARVDGRERLRWIDARLDHDARAGRLWAAAWGIGIGAAGLASLAPVPFVKASDRVDWYTSAATAAFGVIPFVVSPLDVTRDAPKVRATVAALPADADDARVCLALVDAEHKLVADAADERWQRGWWIHAGNLAFNTGVLLFLGLGYHHWSSGLINGVSGAAVGEAIIFTQPTGVADAAASYAAGDLTGEGAGARAARPLGLAYGARF
jgi:hypothetical protein